MKKRFFPIIIALCAVLAFSGAVYAAANRVNLGTNVPNIPKSLCYQSGSITMEFSEGTVLRSGDVIQYTLNNGVVLCKDIDFYLRLHNGEGFVSLPGIDTADPVSATDVADGLVMDPAAVPPIAAGPGVPATYDYGYRVQGLAGSQIVTLTLGSRAIGDPAVPVGTFNNGGLDDFFMTFVGLTANNLLTVSIFDEKWDALDDLLLPYLYKDDPATPGTLYTQSFESPTDPFMPSDNAMCIDTLTFDYQGERVEVTPDSITVLPDNKLTFTGEREIARILAANEYALVTCKDAPVVGNIEVGGGQDAICDYFDFESGLGYCVNTHRNNKIIIRSLTNPYPANNYKVSVEVYVNGTSGDNGVYIATETLGYVATTSLDAACDEDDLTPVPFETYIGPGACAPCAESGVTPGGIGCTVDAANKVIKAITEETDLGITQGGGQTYLRLDLPQFRYDADMVEAGDIVSVKLTVEQTPCGTLFDEEIIIGTIGCEGSSEPASLLYPYFTPANGTYFWSAYAITNISDVDGDVTLEMWESDGDAFLGKKLTPIKAHTIWSTRLDDSIDDPDIEWTQIAGTGTPGDASAYIKALTTFEADGFGFIAGSPTGESMGYLPRVNGHN